ncbi:hypothetical protein JHK85_024933 [Glycine max]|nr:hypothetical protein JHK85_024933 [Glycine max]
MAKVWSLIKAILIIEADNDVFTFWLFHLKDIQRVKGGGGGGVGGGQLFLININGSEVPSQVPMQEIPIWIEVHNIPLGLTTIAVGKKIGNFLDQFVDYDDKHNSSPLMSYMRIKVMIDVNKPLKCTKKIKKEGHNDDLCGKLFKVENDNGLSSWGPELRADARVLRPWKEALVILGK